MKRAIAIVLVLVLALSLCGCDRADYKKAMAAYEADDYETARAIFVGLGDYEDSPKMVMECDYWLALGYMEAGDYQQARDLFTTLGDHRDSADQAKECDYQLALESLRAGDYQKAREMFVKLGDYEDSQIKAQEAAYGMLVEYVLGKESVVSGNAILTTSKSGNLLIGYYFKNTGGINLQITLAGEIRPGEAEIKLSGSDKTSSYAAYYEASGTAMWNKETYCSGDKMTWSEYRVSGRTAQGTAYTKELTFMYAMLTSSVKDMSALLEKVLVESGLGLTMADIGFTAY